ncbi:MAG: SDR family NAD(P)-dependent oxidoreductase [Oscillospiraceae bacterium]|jgi:NAD(P)-dependent dehydrogenase (short-subunit alcohol dehydrogenase family)
MSVKGKVAIVTGAGSGIGEGTARLLAEEGAIVVMMGRGESIYKAAEAMRKDGLTVDTMIGDVGKTEDVERVFKDTYDKYGAIDIVANIAGIGDYHTATVRLTDELWERVVNVNLNGTMRCCREALKYMEKQGSGSIINCSSGAGVRANSGAAYTATKFAVEGLTRNIALNYAGTDIRCNCIQPGLTVTNFAGRPDWNENFDAEFASICDRHMDKDCGSTMPVDQARAVLFFADPDNHYVTGQIICIDRGVFL